MCNVGLRASQNPPSRQNAPTTLRSLCVIVRNADSEATSSARPQQMAHTDRYGWNSGHFERDVARRLKSGEATGTGYLGAAHVPRLQLLRNPAERDRHRAVRLRARPSIQARARHLAAANHAIAAERSRRAVRGFRCPQSGGLCGGQHYGLLKVRLVASMFMAPGMPSPSEGPSLP